MSEKDEILKKVEETLKGLQSALEAFAKKVEFVAANELNALLAERFPNMPHVKRLQIFRNSPELQQEYVKRMKKKHGLDITLKV